ncbi:MAG: flagellar filament capping protein FliD [Oscillibacter sp.]|uniref:flagellar filament capping protein FliD n=1 Tax=Oscillibacter sp. TaxID=1945593 RepID=UPI002173D049|nr:flagellar filament capping protein FliD [Oscillibacter sp.]MCI9113006.1 flagellar filament capping protein FliD [Oscillibacter sp.]
MAVSGVSSSRSIYGNRNVITGLASGMDTESMIENAISAYKNKISALSQKRTKTEWKQDAYRSMISKMSSFLSKYTSYRSANNLMSTSFFDQAVKTVSKGANKDLVSAVGRASSDIRIDRVRQLATAATYKLSGTALDGTTAAFGKDSVSSAASGTLDLDKPIDIGNLDGSLTLAYGGKNATSYLTIEFDETKTYEDDVDADGNVTKSGAQKLVDDINKQLEEQSVSIGTKTYTGKDLLDNVIKAEVGEDGQITFTDPKKNGVYVSAATGSIQEKLLGGKEPSTEAGKQIKSLTLSDDALETTEMSTLEYLSTRGGSMEITLDGKTKTVKLPGKDDLPEQFTGEARDAKFLEALQKNIDDAFGKGKLTVSDANRKEGADGKGIQFQFTAPKGSTFAIGSTKGEMLGFGESDRVTSYLNTGKTLGELLGDKGFEGLEGVKVLAKDKDGKDIPGQYLKDDNGNYIYEKDADGNTLYSFKVNGKEIGQFSKDTTLQTVMNAMNSNADSGVKVAYSKLTNELSFAAKETGAANGIGFEGLSAKLFGAPGTYDDDKRGTYTKGQDAIFEASVNGTSLGEITRSSNEVEMDGMTINLKGTFGYQTDEDGNIRYESEQAKDKDGRLLFSFQGVEKAASENGDKLEFTDEKSGKTVYGTIDADGKLTFTNQAGNQVYARVDAQNRLRFDADASQAVEGSAVMNKTAIKDTKAEGVTFETSSDADKIVDAVKQMVEDYNAMAKEIKDAYSTLPAQRSNGAYYEPLTSEDEEGMSESAIKNWNEKAKQGILFGDRDLASLYQRLTSAVSMTGEHGAALREAGITVNYSNGLSTLEFNEDKFRTALNNNPDKVRDAFTSSMESGAKSNGLMQALKQPLDMYGKTEGGKGLLVEKAGSALAPSTMYNNTIQQELNRIDEQIERWQDKMEDQIDHYTSQFSRLEQLIQQMNSQSSYFSQLMGG